MGVTIDDFDFQLTAKKPSYKKKLEDSLYGEFKLFGLSLPLRQFLFHPKRKWTVDFAWPDLKIIVEVQGGIFMPKGKGGHNRGAYMEKEYEKHNEAARLGWQVYKFGPKALYIKKRTSQSSKALAFLYPLLRPQVGLNTKKAARDGSHAASLFAEEEEF